ncbi:MAG: 2-hydroxyacyl-CoA dehydratase [Clostridiales Family XIII bacterium]|jgi:benzoyl-CoA reductase subunit C|nr:2-hydroxyacyl-CoA dehydratase [Clostridiales Family XIII bacterium]
MKTFKEILENRHAYAKDWKARTGGKVLGFYDTYFPEEVAYAAGLLPLRLLASHCEDALTDRLMYGNCYCTRDIFNQFMLGRYDYVDGLVSIESCQWWYNAFDTTLIEFPELWSHYLFTTDYVDARTSKDAVFSELKIFVKRLEEWIGKTVTDEALDNAIDVYNKNRALLRQLYQLRRFDRTAVLGSEVMEIMLANQVMDKAEANVMLESLLPELEARAPQEDGVRLMLIGSETYDAKLEKLVESLGANIVTDELDNGTAYILNDVIPMKNRLMAIGLRYLGKPHSALKDNVWRRRPEHIYQLYEDFQADGVIIAKQIYCHPHGSDMYAVWKLLRERNIPYHTFERDTTLPYEETKLGVEALISMIKPGMTRLHGWSK